jgi:hypothetical protein
MESANRWFLLLLWKKVRDRLVERPLSFITLLFTLLFIGGLFYWPIKIQRSGKLTDLDQFLFQLFLVGLSGAFSWSLAKRKEEETVLEKQRSLARSAARRIRDITTSAGRLLNEVESCKAELNTHSEWFQLDIVRTRLIIELFDGLARQIIETQSNIAASVEDWRDILPEEFARKEEAEKEILKAQERALHETSALYDKLYSELKKTQEQGGARTSEQIEELSKLVAEQLANVEKGLSIKVEQIRASAGNALPPPAIVVGKQPRRKTLEYVELPLAKIILDIASEPRSFDEIVTLTQAKHGKPQPWNLRSAITSSS